MDLLSLVWGILVGISLSLLVVSLIQYSLEHAARKRRADEAYKIAKWLERIQRDKEPPM